VLKPFTSAKCSYSGWQASRVPSLQLPSLQQNHGKDDKGLCGTSISVSVDNTVWVLPLKHIGEQRERYVGKIPCAVGTVITDVAATGLMDDPQEPKTDDMGRCISGSGLQTNFNSCNVGTNDLLKGDA